MQRTTKYVLCILSLVIAIGLWLKATVIQVPSSTWAPAGNMADARSGAASALLQDGTILVTGGEGVSGVLSSAEVFNAGSFASAPAMNVARSRHAAVVLEDGRVLVTGGKTTGGSVTNAAEVYSPALNSWIVIGSMADARSGHTATLLKDGRVLLAGGEGSAGAVSTLEVFDPASSTFTFVGTMSSARKNHAAALLPDGSVLIAGGSDGANVLSSTQLYDAATGSAMAGPVLSTPRAGVSATTLMDGKVLIAGGNNGTADLATAEIFNSETGVLSPLGSSLANSRRDHSAFLLPNNNHVLIVGGTSSGTPLATTELFRPWDGNFYPTGSMSVARVGSIGSPLGLDGLLLVAGGGALASSELYGFATLKTDKDDYVPGELVTMTGSGWQPGETVTLFLHEINNPDPHDDLTLTALADGSGRIVNRQFAPDEHDLGIRFYLTATGGSSQAQVTFTDGPKVGSVTLGSQTGALTQGTAGSATYTVTVSRGTGPGSSGAFDAALTLTTSLPTGVTGAFSAGSLVTCSSGGQKTCFDSGSKVIRFATGDMSLIAAFTITTTAAAPAGTTSFTVKAATSDSDFATGNGSLLVGAACTAPAVTTNPSNQTIVYGNNASFSAAASGSPTPTVQWQVNSGSGWTDVPLATLPTLSVSQPTVSQSGNQYRAVFTSSCSGTQTATTTAATLTVNKATPTVAVSFAASPITYDGAGHTATATVTGVSGPLAVPGNGTVAFTYKKNAAPFAGTPTDAASYTASASFTSTNDNYNNASSTVDAALVINKATPTVAVSFVASPITYDGAGHAATATVTGVSGALATPANGTVTFSYTKNAAPFAGTPTDAASYTASASFTSTNDNYNNASSTVDAALVINKATPTVAVSFAASPITYDGNGHAATATVTGVSGPLATPANGTVTFSYTKNAAPFAGTPTDAASYTASASFTSTNDNYNNASSTVDASLVINKATPTVAVSFAASPITYDGNGHAATATVTGVSGPLATPANGTVTFSYTKNAAPFVGTPTDAASYTASASFTSTNDNYNNASSTVDASLVINKATPTVAVSFVASPITYDGAGHAATATVTGVSGALATPANGTVTFSYTKNAAPFAGTPTDAASYAASASFTSTNDNYNNASSTVDAALVINKATPTVAVSFAASPITYDGNGHAATATVTGVSGALATPANGTVAFSYTKNAAPFAGTPTDAASYAASASFTSTNDNYNNASSTVDASLVINKATPTVAVSFVASPITYDGAGHAATATVTGVSGALATPANGTVTFSYTKNAAPFVGTPTDAASYTASASFTSTNDNYNNASSTVDASLVINKAASTTVVAVAGGESFTYDGNAHPATVSVTGVGGLNLTPAAVYSCGHAPIIVADSGCTASYNYIGDNNHDGSSDSKTYTISKANPVVSATGGIFTYDGDPHGGAGSATGVKGEALTPVTVAYKDALGSLLSSAPVNAGTYSVAARYAGDGNYNQLQSAAAALTINKAASTTAVTVAGGESFTYDGNAHPATVSVTGAGGLNLTPAPVYSCGHAPINVADSGCTASYNYAGDGNHDGSSDSKTYTISKATSTTVVTVVGGESFTYNGNAHPATVAVTGAGGLNLSLSPVYSCGHAPINVADSGCTASYNYAGDGNHDGSSDSKTYTISKANPVVSATGGIFTFDGDPHGGAGSVTGVKGEALTPVTVAYKDALGSLLSSAPVNAGTYSVAARYAGDGNYNQLQSAAAALTINKAISTTVVTVAGGESFTYDGNAHPATVAVTGAGGLNLTPAPVYSCAHAPINVADSGCTASYNYAGDGNHEESSDSKIYAIIKANPVVSATGGIFTYDGSPHGGAGSATGVKGEALTPVTVAYKDALGSLLSSAPVNAGTYSVAARFAGSDNYNQLQTTVAALTINKAGSMTVVTVVGGESFTYDGNAHPATVVVTGAGGLNLSPSPVYSCGHVPINVADSGCTASYNYTGDINHDGSSDSKTYTISKRASLVMVTFSSNPVGEGSSPWVTAVVSDGGPLPGMSPSGMVMFGSSVASDTFSSPGACSLISTGPGTASCSVTVNVADNSAHTTTATYAGSNAHLGNTGNSILTVSNVLPTVTITAPASGAVFPLGSAVTFAGTFTDPGKLDTHTAQWKFDLITIGGTVSEANGSGSVTNTYTFTTPGVYQITLTITDKDGGVGTANTVGGPDGMTAQVVIYDPNGGFVTGGGWINSPAGAYSLDLSLTGKANFGFVSKYLKGATKPTGETEFQFKAGNLNFHSSYYDWLVVAGAKGQYKGVGEINGLAAPPGVPGATSYKFMLTATDGQLSGGGGYDKLRMKIWYEVGAAVYPVYDNLLGATDDFEAAPTQAIGGGSIVIHK